MHWVQIFVELVPFLAYLGCRLIFGLAQSVWWMFNGTGHAKRNSRKPDAYATSAHVLDIWWRGKFSPLIMPNSILNFVTVHNRFDHPSVVLRDNVTIYAITSSYVMFVEAKDGVDVTNTDFSSFMKIAQFIYAKKVIILPIEAFHRLADQLGDPEGLVFVGNTGRCGSTLLCRIYEETGKCVAFTEPDVITRLSLKYGSMELEKFNRLAVSTVRILCKPVSSQPSAYIIKISGPAMVHGLPPLYRLFPRSRLLFMYRDLVKTAQSYTKIKEEDPLFKMLDTIIVNYLPGLANSCFHAVGFNPEGFDWRSVKHRLSKYFQMFVVICAKYKEMRRDGLPISAIKYEDMLENPEYATRAILRYSGLGDSLVAKSLKAYARDAHKDSHSPFSQQRVNRHKPDAVTPDVRVELDSMCVKMGIPTISEPFLLEETITAPRERLEQNTSAPSSNNRTRPPPRHELKLNNGI